MIGVLHPKWTGAAAAGGNSAARQPSQQGAAPGLLPGVLCVPVLPVRHLCCMLYWHQSSAGYSRRPAEEMCPAKALPSSFLF